MKSAIIALCILSLVAALCCFASNKIVDICTSTELFVNGLPENTDGVSVEDCQKALDQWKEDSAFMSFFISSLEITAIEEALITVKNSVENGSDDEFAAAKAQLIAGLNLIREAELVNLNNIF